MLVAGLIGLGYVGGEAAATCEDGSFADVNSAAQARIQAYNAKSNESLTLIARGVGRLLRGGLEDLGRAGAGPALTGLDADLRHTVAGLRRGPQPDPCARRRRQVGPGGRPGHRHHQPGRFERPLRRLRRTGVGLGRPGERTDQHRSAVTPASGSSSVRCQRCGRHRDGRAGATRRRRPTPGVPMSSRNWRRGRSAPAVLLVWPMLLALVGGCALAEYDPTPLPAPPSPAPSSAPTASSTPARCADPLASYAPSGDQPDPGKMPSASTMAKIAAARPADRRGVGRHLPARLAQPVHRPDRGFRHRHGQGGGRGDLRATRTPTSCKVITRGPADPRRCRRARSTWSRAT